MPNRPIAPPARIGIMAKPRLSAASSSLLEISNWLAERGIDAVFESETATLLPAATNRQTATKAALPSQVDMVLVLGGDGTLLAMADTIAAAGLSIPILGVNFGSLGFLTEVTLPELFRSLEAAISGEASVEERLMLRSLVKRAGQTIHEAMALNDAVITKAARARMIDLTVYVGEEFVTRVRADGLIIATPTGSTAYNLSAGGPILQPAVDALLLTPIAPHTLTNRPIVIPATSPVRVHPNMNERDEVFLTFDGQSGLQIEAGDEVTVGRAETPLRLLKPSTRSYFEVLRTKLKWGER